MQSYLENQIKARLQDILSEYLKVSAGNICFQKASQGKFADAIVETGQHTFVLEFKSSSAKAPMLLAKMHLLERRQSFDEKVIPLVVVPYMGDVGRSSLEKAGISWIDLSGNAYIEAPGLLIRVTGKPNRFKEPGRPANIFAPRSSRIAREFLIHPEQFITQRELAQRTGLDEGFTSRIIHRMEDSSLIKRRDDGALIAHDPAHLLEAWHEVYDFKKHHVVKGHITARSGDMLLRNMANTLAHCGVYYATTGLGAAWTYDRFVAFRLVTIYIKDQIAKDTLEALGFREDERGANTWLVIPNDEGVFQEAKEVEGIHCVHPVQIYLDLKGQPERKDEAAASLREKYLKWRLND